MGAMSKRKGKTGELEIAHLLKEHGFTARRGQQFQGGTDSPDVVHDIPGLHVEVKRTEALKLWDALAQAEADKRPGETATVWHRKNLKPWVVILPAVDFLRMMKERADG